MSNAIKKVLGIWRDGIELYNHPLFSDSSLKAYYRLEAGALTTDSSGNGKTLTNHGTMAEGTGKFGGGGDNGTTGTKYLDIADNLGLAGEGAKSFSFWIKLNTEITSGYYGLFDHLTNLTARREFTITYNYNTGTRQLSLNGGLQYANVNVELGTVWHHIVCTRASGANGTMYIYLDGKPVATGPAGTETGGDTNSFTFGTVAGGTFPSFAIYDDMAVFGKELSAAEVLSLYSSGIKKIGGVYNTPTELYSLPFFNDAQLKAYYRLEANGNDSKNSYHYANSTHNPSYAVAQFGNGALFDGLVTALEKSASWDFTLFDGGGTFSLWILPTEAGEGAANDGARIYNANDFLIHLPNLSGNILDIFLQHAFSTTAGSWKASASLPLNIWSHVAIVYNNSATTNDPIIYVNGVSKSITENATPVGTRTAATGYTDFGNNVDNGVRAYKGYMDDIALFTRALSADEIMAIYQSGIKKIGGIANV